MKILYTHGKIIEPIYLDESQYELVKDYKFYVSGNNLICRDKGTSKSIASILYPKLRRAIRIDTTVHDYRISNIQQNKESSVYKVNVKGYEYYVGKIYKAGKYKIVPGYYKTRREALIIREAYILHRGIKNVTRNDLGLSTQEILDEYDRVLKEKEKQIRKTTRQKARKRHKLALQTSERYGIYKGNARGKDFYRVSVKGVEIGGSKDLKVAKCIRNIYIADNKIRGDKIYDVGMSLEEQREFVKEYKGQARLKTEGRKKYRGVNKQVRGNCIVYSVQLYSNGVRKFIGSSQDEKLAAMMYNIHKFKVGQAKESINDVGLTIEKQIAKIKRSGYHITEDCKFKKK